MWLCPSFRVAELFEEAGAAASFVFCCIQRYWSAQPLGEPFGWMDSWFATFLHIIRFKMQQVTEYANWIEIKNIIDFTCLLFSICPVPLFCFKKIPRSVSYRWQCCYTETFLRIHLYVVWSFFTTSSKSFSVMPIPSSALCRNCSSSHLPYFNPKDWQTSFYFKGVRLQGARTRKTYVLNKTTPSGKYIT